MGKKEDFEKRLEDLDWTLYRLAKEFAQYRAAGGDVSPASRYHSTLSKAIENPGTSKLETIEDIVKVLNGELTIVWEANKVVTIRLEEDTLKALKQRAATEGKTINEIAKQLLLQALSGIPARQSKLVIAEEAKIYRSFHPIIASAYSAVHQWLAAIPEAQGYKELDYSRDISQSLDKTDLKSIAFQFYTLFPRYYFEATHILDNVIHSPMLLKRLKYNPRICIVDVGCAMGAATAAFIEKLLTLPKDEIESKTIEIVCIGIDTSIYGYAVYQKFMQEIQKNIIHFNLKLEFKPLNEPVSKATISTISYLQNKLKGWNLPVLSHLFVMQLDMASSISKDEILKRERNKKLKDLGLEPDLEIENDKEFWQEEALSLKQLLEEVPVDNLHYLTIDTKNLEKKIKQINQENQNLPAIEAISEALDKFIGKNHKISEYIGGEQKVYFENPVDSYWQEQQQINYTATFNAAFKTIKNRETEEDNDWNKLITIENIELAWVKARSNVFNESFYDEIEIKIFENNLDQNLQRLFEYLIEYSEELIPLNQEINYQFVKGASKGRPKQLSRLEEEILAIALLQTIGQKSNLEFYSYHLNLESTEELYENYFPRYKNFLKESGESAESYPDGAVIRTDIQSYYVKVVQEQLLEITERELQITSKRIKWLLQKILKQNLDENHQEGKGLKQGTLTSGFYANLYLKSVDDYFKNDPQYKDIVKYHRFVDDMILVVRHQAHLEEIELKLIEKISNFELRLNKNKTEHYHNITEFLPTIKLDKQLEEKLDKLNKNFNFLLAPLWRMNYNYRTQFEFAISSKNETLWWELVKNYQYCLYSINIYIRKTDLSRRIYQKLVEQKLNHKKELKLPNFINDNNFVAISKWSSQFKKLNNDWLEEKKQIKTELVNFFQESLEKFKIVYQDLNRTENLINEQKKRQLKVEQRTLEMCIRFTVNKLLILGFDEVEQEIVDLICDPELFIIRELLDIIVGLAHQGLTEAINKLWEYYENCQQETSSYLRAVILESFRFLPIVEQEYLQIIFSLSTEGKSDIEKLKATETWLYLGEIAKPFVQPQHFQAIVNALKSVPPPFARLKKNYILILGMYNSDLLDSIPSSPEDQNDYLIKEALKLSQNRKVSELFKEVEPARVRQYYNLKQVSLTKDKQKYSL